MKTCLVRRRYICEVIEDVPDIIDVEPAAALALPQQAQGRRVGQEDILDFHHDRLGSRSRNMPRIKYLYATPWKTESRSAQQVPPN
jgi:hypothetical protein